MQLKGRTSYAKWWLQVEWKARDDKVQDLVDPDRPDALAYNTSLLAPPPTINELKKKLDAERAFAHIIAVNEWNTQQTGGEEPNPVTKPSAPLPATFEDVKAKHIALLQDYIITSNVHKTRFK